MKIVNVEDFFHPDAGYQVNILSKYHVSFGHEVTVICSEITKMPVHLTNFFDCSDIEKKDDEFTRKYGVKIIRLPIAAFISGRSVFWKHLIKTINNENPDVLFAHGNDTYTTMYLLFFRKLIHCPIVTDSHMVDMASSNKFKSIFRFFYKTFITPIIVKNNIPVIRTTDDEYVSKRLGIPIEIAPVISFGSDTLLFHPDIEARKKFRLENRIADNEFVVIYAGKLDESKGGLLLANAILKHFDTNKKVTFIIIGKTFGEQGAEIESLFNQSENSIIRFPTQKYQDLSLFYQASDLAVFPKQCSLSFFDVQACGLPVLSEDNVINIPRCNHENGFNFMSNNVDDFRKKLNDIVNMNHDDFNKLSQNSVKFIHDNYDYEKRARDYENILIKTKDLNYTN